MRIAEVGNSSNINYHQIALEKVEQFPILAFEPFPILANSNNFYFSISNYFLFWFELFPILVRTISYFCKFELFPVFAKVELFPILAFRTIYYFCNSNNFLIWFELFPPYLSTYVRKMTNWPLYYIRKGYRNKLRKNDVNKVHKLPLMVYTTLGTLLFML